MGAIINPFRFGGSGPGLLSSNEWGGYVGSVNLFSTQYHATGECLNLGADKTITKVAFYMYKSASPTGNMYLKLRRITGTLGTNAVPTGSDLVSQAVAVSVVGASRSWVEITLDTEYLLTSGGFWVGLEYTGGDATNHLVVSYSSVVSSQNLASFFQGTTWYPDSGSSHQYRIYGY